ncbi:sigma-70 family RNA polymerase sigma factor [Pedobacter hiemivivus]|uniref:Sigma-70 family RNA polymerase sigma factor n=1 Tax=Pedobacter hiemivivus TaxID=2530454 RepID=A0A4U1GFI8_9SPHI|nr:sigma-70 family RNA polymerase sigma factor [Pedobacter hiemivivus]TKC62504.1 sigma-70 family RNA polymerase sigma factor [Pedobacter hiemivivus]
MNNYKKLSDVELVAHLKNGDRNAFTAIYDRYWGVLFLHARKMLGNDEDSREIVEEVLIYLWNNIDEIHITSDLSTYLYSSARHEILNIIKRSDLKEKCLQSLMRFEVQDSDLNDEINTRELTVHIEASVERLPEEMQEEFESGCKVNLSHKLTSEKRNSSENTIKKNKE